MSLDEDKLQLEREKLAIEKHRVLLQTRLFEIDQLRKEILQHDSLATQIVNWTIGGSLAAAAYSWTLVKDNDKAAVSAFVISIVAMVLAGVGVLNDLVRTQSNVHIGTFIAARLEPGTGVTWETHLLAKRKQAVASGRWWQWWPWNIWSGGARSAAVTLFYLGTVAHAVVWALRLGMRLASVLIPLLGVLALILLWWRYLVFTKGTLRENTDATTIPGSHLPGLLGQVRVEGNDATVHVLEAPAPHVPSSANVTGQEDERHSPPPVDKQRMTAE